MTPLLQIMFVGTQERKEFYMSERSMRFDLRSQWGTRRNESIGDRSASHTFLANPMFVRLDLREERNETMRCFVIAIVRIKNHFCS